MGVREQGGIPYCEQYIHEDARKNAGIEMWIRLQEELVKGNQDDEELFILSNTSREKQFIRPALPLLLLGYIHF
jgi:hypothetical protein